MERTASWPGLRIGTDAALSGGGSFAQQILRYLAFPRDPTADYSRFDFDATHDALRLRAKSQIYDADDV